MADETTYVQNSSCQNCYFFKELKKDLEDHISKSETIKTKIDDLENIKVSWGHFKWIIGGLCACFIIVFGWNVVEQRNVVCKLDSLACTVNELKVNQAVMTKDIEHLKEAINQHIELEKKPSRN